MRDPLPVITQPPPGAHDRARFVLRSRRWAIAAALAAAEVLYVVVAGPGLLVASMVAFLVLVGAAFAISHTGPGLVRDALTVVAIAQAMMLLVPIMLGFSIALGLVIAVFAVIVLVAAVLRPRQA